MADPKAAAPPPPPPPPPSSDFGDDDLRPPMTLGDDGLMHSYHEKQKGEAARNWDFQSQRKETHLSTVFEGVANLVKSCLGGGVVAIHTAYMAVGMWTAVSLNVVLGIFVSYMMIVLAKSAQTIYGRVMVPAMSYPDLAEAACDISHFKCLRRNSRVLRYLVDTTIMIDLFGSCCCYQLLMATQVEQMIKTYLKYEMSVRLLVAIFWLPCVALCMILKLKYLAWCSIFADIILVAVAVSTAVYGSIHAANENYNLFAMKPYKGFFPLFVFIGTCVFSMEGVGVTLPIENSLEKPRKIGLVLTLGMTVVVSIVMSVGFFGYYGYQENCASPVTKNFPFSDWWAILLKIMLPIMIYVTFALNFWVPFRLVWAYFIKKYPNRPECAERIYRAIIVTVITIISIAFPAVDELMGLIGSFCLSNMGFIYPAFIELLLEFEDPGLGKCKWRLIKFFAILIFGLVLMVCGTYSNASQLIKKVFNKK